MTPSEGARSWIERGFHPIPVPHATKKPVLQGWQKLRISLDEIGTYFNGQPQNIGILLGEFGAADMDLDWPEAVAVAREFAPETALIFGRRSKPSSHYLYRSDPPVPTRRFKDPTIEDHEKHTILELRCQTADGGIGLQTIVPPSVHKDTGEPIEFEPGFNGHPANVDAGELLVSRVRNQL